MKQDAIHQDARSARAKSTPPARSTADLIGATIGDFRIVKKLGQGGMGRVYLAEQISLKRKVAIKVLREDLAANPIAVGRFESESKTVARFSHPNVVQVYLVGEHQGMSFVVLEYVEGKSLQEYLATQGRLDAPLMLSLMRQVGSALERASELGVVHRDVKPSNILLTRKCKAKVVDFGLSRCLNEEEKVDLTRIGTAVGTPLYMSPEQLEGRSVDFRSDVYSFGVTCYHALTGHPPFEGSNPLEVALKHVREEPPPLEGLRPDLPPELCAIVAKMMAKRRRDRYQTPREFLDDVARVRALLGATSGYVPLVGGTTEMLTEEDEERPKAAAALWKQPVYLVGLAGLVVLMLSMIGVLVASLIILRQPSEPPSGKQPVVEKKPTPEVPKDPEEALRKAVERHFEESPPSAAGVDACIELGVLYLEKNKVREARALFERMEKERAPSPYHFVGMLGVAVTDSLQKHYRTSRGKYAALFEGKPRDDRAQIVEGYLAKHPGFMKWAEHADSLNDKFASSEPSMPQKKWRFPFKVPTKKP